MERADNPNIKPCRLFQQRLHLRAVFANYAKIVSSCLARPVLVGVKSAEFAETVGGEKHLVTGIVADDNLWPMHHRRGQEGQLVGAKGKPVTIYLMLNLIVHLANCIYFIFAMDYFPYSATQFSELYMEQQMGIWITFIILTALVTGFLGNKGYVYRVIAFFAIMAYSFLFGTVRYIVFMFLVTRFSILYMAPMFFSFGPLFDFLYLVAIYSVFVNRMVKLYDSAEGRGEWRW